MLFEGPLQGPTSRSRTPSQPRRRLVGAGHPPLWQYLASATRQKADEPIAAPKVTNRGPLAVLPASWPLLGSAKRGHERHPGPLMRRPRTGHATLMSDGRARRRRMTDENRAVQVAGNSGWRHHPERGGRGPDARGLVVSALFFFPRGGSAHVARSLAGALPAAGWRSSLATGSLGQPGEPTHAASFFAGIDLHTLDYSPALGLAQPLAAPVPFQPSYEDRPNAPDRIFAAVDDGAYERLVAAWIELLARAGAGAADLLHLHHLTPANEATARGFPSLPVLGQLHGTELAMLRTIEAGAPPGWRYAQAWSRRLRAWARHCALLVVPPGAEDAASPSRARAREVARAPERRRARALLPATARRRGATRVLAPLARRAAARLGSERSAGEHRLPRRGARFLPGRWPDLPLRRSLHGGEAPAASDQRPRACGRAARQTCAARARRRPSGRVGGGASARHRTEDRERPSLPRRLAPVRGASPGAERGRRARPAIRRRGVRARP